MKWILNNFYHSNIFIVCAYAAGGANYLAGSAGALEIAIIIQGAIEVL